MRIEKKVMSKLTKCYSIAPLRYREKDHILVASEKDYRCVLFDLDGNEEDTVWEGPGGTMSMVQVPGTDGQFLATHQFYSPNDSAGARIVIVTPEDDGWKVRTLVELPFVHRFDILQKNGINYLIACTIKSNHQQQEDWSSPGKVYAAVLPEELDACHEDNQLQLTVLKDGLTKNHGYYRVEEECGITAVISSENGIFQFYPPENPEDEWTVRELLDTPASDALLLDLDGDGEKELVVLAPFHGDFFSVYKRNTGGFEKVYEYPERLEFLHAIYGGEICGKNRIIVGHRKGERKLLSIAYDKEEKQYRAETVDSGCGPANVYPYVKDGRDIVIATNREIDEIAMYTLTQ